jgi:asparagine synthase (glutamine-hydrolysing)
MCGIVGIASCSPVSNRAWLSVARDEMIHRGPDAAGEWWSADSRVGLAHRRLSIIDLSGLASQPMLDPDQGLAIVFNGEIYNFKELRDELISHGHRFHSSSDTEVLLKSYCHWGVDFLTRLNGMFALVIYDESREEMILARDRAGEKPLFYRLEGEALYFASELKALLVNSDFPRRINPISLDCYFAMGYVPADNCILSGYNKLPAAHAMSFCVRSGSSKIWRYWDLPECQFDLREDRNISETLLLDELENLIEDAVARQMVADVPVGILLSGGLDSSIITAMAVRHSKNVRTFSIGFKGHSRFDESSHAKMVADHFCTEHTVLHADSNLAELLPMLVRHFDEPMVDSSMFPMWVVSNLVKRHCKVALGGDGGDELFGGYDQYSSLLRMKSLQSYVPAWLRYRMSIMAERNLPVGFKGRNYILGLEADLKNNLPFHARLFDYNSRQRLMGMISPEAFCAENIFMNRIVGNADLVQRAIRSDFKNYLVDDILVKVDRASMSNSLEVRTPFLDYRLIEFAFGRIPSHLKATRNERKIFLKRLACRFLPSQYDFDRKQGFTIPLADWLRAGEMRDLFWEVLTDPGSVYDSTMTLALLKSQDRGYSNTERLFSMVQFEIWRKMYSIEL